jgi:hypothetical protein
MHVTFVKKILADGTPCRKCLDVEARLKAGGYWARIDEIRVADERDPDSSGWPLVREFNVGVAPFFVVREGDTAKVYSIFLQLVREVLAPTRGPMAAAVDVPR